eukprot:676152-Amphidinium_carterae.1
MCVCVQDVCVKPLPELHEKASWQSSTRRCTAHKRLRTCGKRRGGTTCKKTALHLAAATPPAFAQTLGKAFVTAMTSSSCAQKRMLRRSVLYRGAPRLAKQLEVPNRTVRLVDDDNGCLIEIEADQKHVPQLLEDFGLTKGNAVKTRRVKLNAAEAAAVENSPLLNSALSTFPIRKDGGKVSPI